ncbi:MAG: T9SS type A sorting domain-containing protein, partial [Bacteroidia bacterium]
YYVKRYDIVLHAGATANFCFAGTCYPDITTISSSNTLTAGQSASQVGGSNQILTTDLNEAPTAGLSVIKYTFRNANVTADSVQFTLKYNGTAGLKENAASLNNLEIYPNPSNGATAFKVNAATSMKTKLMVYNSLGTVVSEKQVNLSEGKNKIDLETESLPLGVYFVTLNNGTTTLTKKLIIK